MAPHATVEHIDASYLEKAVDLFASDSAEKRWECSAAVEWIEDCAGHSSEQVAVEWDSAVQLLHV